MNEKVQNTIRNLILNGFSVRYFENGGDAGDTLLGSIDVSESVGIGGSVTLTDLGIYNRLKQRGNQVHWHGAPGTDKKKALAAAATADVYLSGTNAVTEDGRLINIDGTGNRLSSLLFGHDRIYIIVGVNKISRNYEEAMIRIKNVVCPQNTERLGLDTPCRHLGKCTNCDSPQRICNATLILDRQPAAVKINIFLINENLGY